MTQDERRAKVEREQEAVDEAALGVRYFRFMLEKGFATGTKEHLRQAISIRTRARRRLRYHALRLNPEVPDWRPTETIPEDHYAL